MLRALRVHRQAVELAGEADGEVEDVDHLLHFAVSLGPDLSHLEADQVSQRLLDLPQQVAEIAQELASPRGRGGAPIEEALAGGSQDPVIGLGRRLADAGQGLTGGRVERHELGAGRVVDPCLRPGARAGIQRP